MSKCEMAGLKHTAKIREYCDYIDEHLHNVAKAWSILQETCRDDNIIYDDHLFFVTDQMIKDHDLSKVSPEEFIQYQRNFFPVEKKDDTGFEAALGHHLLHNGHHWEKWAEIKCQFPNEWACHCACMICDWLAMSMKFGDTARVYYDKNKDRIIIPDYADRYIYKIFAMIEVVYPGLQMGGS